MWRHRVRTRLRRHWSRPNASGWAPGTVSLPRVSSQNIDPTPPETNPHRLPRTVEPRSYLLRLEPDLTKAAFTGEVTIEADAHEPTSHIVLNAIELDIGLVTVRTGASAAEVEVEVQDIRLDEDLERLTIALDEPMPAGPCQITIGFTGVLNDKLRGFYRSTFTDDDGNDHVLATTQFESTNARRAFPCWDEPDFKAVFDVTLVVDQDLLAVSCQSEVSSTPREDGRREVRFAPTPLMSTYLVAFVVGNLEATAPVTAGGVPMRIIHVPGKGPQTQFALDAGKFALDWLTDYFGIPYPGDKCDMIAIPDFAFGAMENLGCVTYREILLLVDPETTTQPEQQRSVDVIAHELAHMWFGDLVTMKWWNGLWLKEAFATFMEMLVADAYRPDWNRWVDFGLSRTGAFDVDSLQSTRPIEFEVKSPDDAEGMYDILTYEKGAAVVRMLQQYLGEEAFRTGVSKYLSQHAFANTETHDLWDALEESTGQPVRRIMDSWIFQGGYPQISVSLADDQTLRLSQSQFRYAGEPDDSQWGVPVMITCGSAGERTTSRVLLDGPTVHVGPDAAPDWVLVNTSANGFYRVSYSPDLRAALLGNLNALEPIERYSVLDDLWAQVVSGDATVADAIDALGHFGDETDVSVWQRVLGILGSLDHLATAADRPKVAALTRTMLRPHFDQLGTVRGADEDDRTNELRSGIFRALGNLGEDEDVIAIARKLNADEDTDPSVRSAALSIVAHHGTAAEFAAVRSRFDQATTPQEERRTMYALAAFPGRAEFDTLLNMTIDGSIRTQDAPYVLGTALQNREHGAAAWQFIKERWDQINDLFPNNAIPRMLGGIRSLSEPEVASDIATFLADHPVPQAQLTVDQHLERLAINVDLRARVAPVLAAHLPG